MKKIYKYFFLLSFLSFSCHLWAYDTLLYRSGFEERQVKQAMAKAVPDFIALFTSITTDSLGYQQHRTKVNAFYNYLNPKLASLKTGKQKAKLIFKEVHTFFFKKYEENVMFYKIFEDG